METIHNHVRAAKISGIDPIIRIKNNKASEISKALDSGASGIQVPNINSADQVHKIVRASKFSRRTKRGLQVCFCRKVWLYTKRRIF